MMIKNIVFVLSVCVFWAIIRYQEELHYRWGISWTFLGFLIVISFFVAYFIFLNFI